MRFSSLLAMAFLISAPLTLLAADPQPAASAPVAKAQQNVTPDEAEKLLREHKEIVVLDVRTPEEFSAGHLAGAKNLDLQSSDFPQKLAELDKSKTYLVHCAAGSRSARACKQMQGLDFGQVYHMNGGFSAWQAAGKPVEK